jgi:regulatory protein
MGTITEIRTGKQRGKRVHIYIDGRFALALDTEIAVGEKLKVGTGLEADRLAALARQEQVFRCREAAMRFLGYRPRSEAELRQRLQKKGFPGDVIGDVLKALREQGLVDDTEFARFWTENRESFSPRSQASTRRELRQKGVAPDVVDAVVSTIDDEDSAYRTAARRAGRMTVKDYQEFRRRLGAYLRRRGFNYDIINKTVEKIWQEKGEA